MRLFFVIVCLALFSVPSSCSNRKQKLVQKDNSAQVDSIENWIRAIDNNEVKRGQKSVFINIIEKINTLQSDSLKGKLLSDLSYSYYSIKDSANFRQANKALETHAHSTIDSSGLAIAYWDLGAFYNWEAIAKRDSALYFLTKAQKIYELIGDTVSNARVLKSIAGIQTDIHDNTGALVILNKAIELLKPTGDNFRIFEVYNLMGVASAALFEYEEALNYYDLANQHLEDSNTSEINLSRLENNVGLAYFNQADFKNAKLQYQRAISRDSLYLLDPGLYAKLLDHLAMTDFKLGDITSVEDKLYRSQFLRDSIGDLEGLSLNYYNLAMVNKEIGNRADAFIFATNAKDLALEIDNNLRYLESLKLLAELDPENALAYNREYIRVADSLQKEERRIRNKFDRIRFETDETLAENEVLARQRMLWAGIAMGVFLFGVALMIIVLQRIKNQRLRFQQQQQEANQEIFNLMLSQKQKVEEGKQSEQKRISEELHDGILGEMNGIRMVLLGLNNKKDEAAIAFREQAIEKLKDVQEEIRTISHELNDASYQKFHNFINSLEDLLKNICEPAKLDYQLTYDHDVDWDNLQGITKINLYRIFQESLQNSVKHAQASNLYVSLETNEKDMVITIQDNGRGFDTSKSKKGIGHRNIKSRMNKIKGRWYLRSAPGVGTTLVLEIPLEHISQEAKKGISLPKDLLEV